jgi:hypothetical protein
MGNHISGSLEILSVGTLSQTELFALFQIFDAMCDNKSKTITLKAFSQFIYETVPSLFPFTHVLFAPFRWQEDPEKMSSDGFFRLVQSLTYVGRDNFHSDSFPMILFSFLDEKREGRFTISACKKLGNLLAKCGEFKTAQARKMLAEYRPKFRKDSLTKEEFVAFFNSFIPRRVSSSQSSSEKLEKDSGQIRTKSLDSPMITFDNSESELIDMKGLEKLLDSQLILPNWFATVSMGVFGGRNGMSRIGFANLKQAVLGRSFASIIFRFFDENRDGIWSPSECIKAGHMLRIPEWRNRMVQWNEIADECRLLFGKNGVCEEWFVRNMLHLY